MYDPSINVRSASPRAREEERWGETGVSTSQGRERTRAASARPERERGGSLSPQEGKERSRSASTREASPQEGRERARSRSAKRSPQEERETLRSPETIGSPVRRDALSGERREAAGQMAGLEARGEGHHEDEGRAGEGGVRLWKDLEGLFWRPEEGDAGMEGGVLMAIAPRKGAGGRAKVETRRAEEDEVGGGGVVEPKAAAVHKVE